MTKNISIHAPREGCDSSEPAAEHMRRRFQSTHPARGATRCTCASGGPSQISIHAPREGCDLVLAVLVAVSLYFNPRTPRGVRPWSRGKSNSSKVFQSTHPARGATISLAILRGANSISIHAPREGCDALAAVLLPAIPYFNPRTPRGVRRPATRGRSHLGHDFNPRTPRGVRQQTLPKSREFAWLNLLICTRGRRLSIQKQTRLCSIKLSFMLFGCEPAGEGVSSWTSHATKSKVRLEGRSA